MKVYIESLDRVGGAERFKIGETVKISPFASLMARENAVILGASTDKDGNITGRMCVRGESGLLGHYIPSMLERVLQE